MQDIDIEGIALKARDAHLKSCAETAKRKKSTAAWFLATAFLFFAMLSLAFIIVAGMASLGIGQWTQLVSLCLLIMLAAFVSIKLAIALRYNDEPHPILDLFIILPFLFW